MQPADALLRDDLLPATYPPLRWLRLPDRYAISAIGTPDGIDDWLMRLDKSLATGVQLVQFREPAWPQGPDAADLADLMRRVRDRCHAAGARLLINSVHPRAWWDEADGVHLRAADAATTTERPDVTLVGVSTHDAEQLAQARAIDANFAVLGPVLATASHPDQTGMGWPRFAELSATAGIPVFALGGQSAQTHSEARRHGGHGIAAIRGL